MRIFIPGSLAFRFALNAAVLAAVALVAAAFALRPIIQAHQLTALDVQMAEDAQELFRDITHFRGSIDYRHPVPAHVLPLTLVRPEYQFELEGPDGLRLNTWQLGDQDFSGPPGFRLITHEGQPRRFLTTEPHGFYTLHLSASMQAMQASKNAVTFATVRVLPLAACGVFCLSWWLAHRALRPLTALTVAAEKIDATSPDHTLPLPPSRDELHRLTLVLNDSFGRLSHAYDAAARFSADASHQLKTPLTILRAGLDTLRHSPTLSPEHRPEMASLLKQTRRLTTLTEDLLLLAQLDAGRAALMPEPLDLAANARSLLDDLDVMALDRSLTIEHDIPQSLIALADPRRVGIILQNLGENAVKYATPQGTLRLTCGLREGQVWLRLANTSAPIPPELRDRLFERFYRASVGENIRGHGLGLSIALALARAMHGTLTLAPTEAPWTAFELTLPTGPQAVRSDLDARSLRRAGPGPP
jgi:signal transduction histidine kinase